MCLRCLQERGAGLVDKGEVVRLLQVHFVSADVCRVMQQVQYAVELGFDVAPIEAYVRTQTGRYLDSWYKRLRDAYVETMADMGVTTDLQGQEFLEAMERRKQVDPTMALLETAIKATAKGAIGKLRQRSRGQVPYYEPYPALDRWTWRPDIRAAVSGLVVSTRARFGFEAAGGARPTMPGSGTSPRLCRPSGPTACSPPGSRGPTSSSSSRSRPTASRRCTPREQLPRPRAGRGVHRRGAARHRAVDQAPGHAPRFFM